MNKGSVLKYGHHIEDFEEDIDGIDNQSEKNDEENTILNKDIDVGMFYNEYLELEDKKINYFEYLLRKSKEEKNRGHEFWSNYIYKVYLKAIYEYEEEERYIQEERDREKSEDVELYDEKDWERLEKIKQERKNIAIKENEYSTILSQIVDKKIEMALNGEKNFLSKEQYEKFKQKVSGNLKRVEDTGEKDGKFLELTSFKILDAYFNVEYREDLKMCVMSYDESCSTKEYGYLHFEPYSSYSKEDFINDTKSSYSINEPLEVLEQKSREIRDALECREETSKGDLNVGKNYDDIDEQLEEARKIAKLANEKVKYLEEIKKARELLQDYEKLDTDTQVQVDT